MGFFDSLDRKIEASRQRALAERKPQRGEGLTNPLTDPDPSAPIRDAIAEQLRKREATGTTGTWIDFAGVAGARDWPQGLR